MTHYACDKRIKEEGGQAKCCECYPHEGCQVTPMTPQQQPEKEYYGTTSVDGLPIEEAIGKQDKENRERNAIIDFAKIHGYMPYPLHRPQQQPEGANCLVDHYGGRCTCPGFNGNPPSDYQREHKAPHPKQEQQGELIELIKVWRKTHNDLRFGQWLWNAMNWHGLWESPEANALFFIEDEDLAKKLKEVYEDD